MTDSALSRLRNVLGPLPCLFGIHNWSEPRAVNSVTLHGEKQDDGNWEHWTDDPSKKVSQACESCPRYRQRTDLDWHTLSERQRGDDSPE